MKRYRVAFDYSAENPTNAVIYLLGIIEDPNLQDMKINWLVTDLDSGEEHKLFALQISDLQQLLEDAELVLPAGPGVG
jgi:hypothetical protein